MVKNLPAMQETHAGDLGSSPGSGRLTGAGNGNPLQYSCLENPILDEWCNFYRASLVAQ